MSLTIKQKKLVKYLIHFLILGMLFGASFAIILTRKFSLEIYLKGSVWGLLTSFFGLLGNYTFLQRFRKLPFYLYMLIKSIYFVIVAVSIILIPISTGQTPIKVNFQFVIFASILFTIVISFIFNITMYIQRLLGHNVLTNFFLGKYHNPIEEERIFMFLDLVGSTSIAEKIGHIQFHKFLNSFMYDCSEFVLLSGGEIYKYVGDELIITWTPEIGFRKDSCIELFFNIKDKILNRKDYYLKKFGVIPEFRAGLHFGKVVTGELGDIKQEIAFLGDTMNTTARIQEVCKKQNRNFLISSSIKNNLPVKSNYIFESLGDIILKGKEEKLELFSVTVKLYVN